MSSGFALNVHCGMNPLLCASYTKMMQVLRHAGPGDASVRSHPEVGVQAVNSWKISLKRAVRQA